MSGRQPEAASDLAKLTPTVMWFAGASANFPCPCLPVLFCLGHPSINAAWHRLLRKMTFATEAVLTTLTRDGRADRQMNRRRRVRRNGRKREKNHLEKRNGERRKEGRRLLLCSQRILDQKVVHRSLAPSFPRSFPILPFSSLLLISSSPSLARSSPVLSLSLHSAP